MDQNTTLWSRFGHWLDSFKPDDTVPQLTLTSTIDAMPTPSVDTDDEPDASVEKSANRLMPWRKRDQILEQLQGGYDKVLRLDSERAGLVDLALRPTGYNVFGRRSRQILKRLANTLHLFAINPGDIFLVGI